MLDWLRQRAAEVETLTSVCTGSMLLGFAGLLDGRHATTHWKSLDWMRDSFPSVTVDMISMWSRTAGADFGRHFRGIDMALKAVADTAASRSPAPREAHGVPLSGQQRSPGLSMKSPRLITSVLTVTDMDPNG